MGVGARTTKARAKRSKKGSGNEMSDTMQDVAASTQAKVEPSLTSVNLEDIPEVQRTGKASKIIEAFLASGMDAAEIQDGAKTFGVALKRYVKANDVAVEVITRKGHTYLKAV